MQEVVIAAFQAVNGIFRVKAGLAQEGLRGVGLEALAAETLEGGGPSSGGVGDRQYLDGRKNAGLDGDTIGDQGGQAGGLGLQIGDWQAFGEGGQEEGVEEAEEEFWHIIAGAEEADAAGQAELEGALFQGGAQVAVPDEDNAGVGMGGGERDGELEDEVLVFDGIETADVADDKGVGRDAEAVAEGEAIDGKAERREVQAAIVDGPVAAVPPTTVKEAVAGGVTAGETLIGTEALDAGGEPGFGPGSPTATRFPGGGVQVTVNDNGRDAGEAGGEGGMGIAAMHVAVEDVVGAMRGEDAAQVAADLEGLVGAGAGEDAGTESLELAAHARIDGAGDGEIHPEAAGGEEAHDREEPVFDATKDQFGRDVKNAPSRVGSVHD